MEEEMIVNLCTFMGRKNNVKILLVYVEEALKINAIDNYYMIDMTRNHKDHEYIFSEQQRLNELYPERVHVVNREIRRKQLDDNTAMDTIGSWAPFYEFCSQFSDNDVIIKCDDDTTYFDVETIRAAAEVRFKNKHPFLMHGNTINNGICAFHQQRKGIWTFEGNDVLDNYPTSGLTGPLFSHPEIACGCHEQFTRDLIADESNISKYALNSNPYFTARVSINMIFMLGSDRDIISKIDTQDEYVSSSKIGQQTDRPNMLIGDFTCAHHTYGVQEPVMEELGTYKMYKELADKYCSNDTVRTNKSITQPEGQSLTLKSDDIYLARYWSGENSITIKNNRTDKYINLDWVKTERVKFIEDKSGKKERVGTGVYWYKAELSASDKPMVFNLDDKEKGNLQIQDCTEIFKTSQPGNKAERFMTFPVKKWFQQNYKKQYVKINNIGTDEAQIETPHHPGFNLVADDRNPDKTLYFFTNGGEDTWTVEDLSNTNNLIVPISIDRGNQDECENDPTTARVVNDDSLPECRNFREFYWMVNGYIWEMVPQGDNECHVKLIADDLDDLYLSGEASGKVRLSANKDLWKLSTDKFLIHNSTKLKLSISPTGVEINLTGTKLS